MVVQKRTDLLFDLNTVQCTINAFHDCSDLLLDIKLEQVI